jgi:hypothetical protein
MGPCPRKGKLAKYGFIYPQAVHGPFGHICATSRQADVFVYKTGLGFARATLPLFGQSKRESGATINNHMSPTHTHLTTTTTTGQNERKTGPNDASCCLGPGMALFLHYFSFIN